VLFAGNKGGDAGDQRCGRHLPFNFLAPETRTCYASLSFSSSLRAGVIPQMDSSALLAHIVSQTHQNVEFLISQRQISPTDGRDILAKLPNAPDRFMAALEQQTQNLLITPPPSTGPTPGYPQTIQAKALWGYNEQAQVHCSLSRQPSFSNILRTPMILPSVPVIQ
jgi:hypothetical protein